MHPLSEIISGTRAIQASQDSPMFGNDAVSSAPLNPASIPQIIDAD